MPHQIREDEQRKFKGGFSAIRKHVCNVLNFENEQQTKFVILNVSDTFLGLVK